MANRCPETRLDEGCSCSVQRPAALPSVSLLPPMNETSETNGLRRAIRGDLIIAICALFISLAATAASWWQSRVVAEQLSAQVWPYLSIDTSYQPSVLSVDIVNNGLGPAIICSTVLSLDGKPIANALVGVTQLLPHHAKRHFGLDMSDLKSGEVIRASGSVQLLHLSGATVVPLFVRNAKRFDLHICYCSLLGNCWLVSANATGDPTPVARCSPVGAAQYTIPLTP